MRTRSMLRISLAALALFTMQSFAPAASADEGTRCWELDEDWSFTLRSEWQHPTDDFDGTFESEDGVHDGNISGTYTILQDGSVSIEFEGTDNGAPFEGEHTFDRDRIQPVDC